MELPPATGHPVIQPTSRVDPAFVAILAGVCAALHMGKLPPAITALQADLGLTLVQAGFLLSMVQLAGMLGGVAFGTLADGLGPRRSMLLGLCILALASVAGSQARSVQPLMLLRACEGFGFLLVVLAAPALVRRVVAPERLNLMLGLWGAYMPLATTLALLAGPWVIQWWSWSVWWLGLAALTLAMALWLALAVPRTLAASRAASASRQAWWQPLARTLAAPGPWLVAVAFAMYSGQWLAVIGFLPTVYAQSGWAGTYAGALTALAAAVNMVGNVSAGRLLHGGTPPVRLLVIGYVTMGVMAVAAFAGTAPGGTPLPPGLRYAAVLLYSAVGGLVPATLFTLAMRLAPGEGMVSATVGWVQQWSAFGQFTGPPLVAWVASRAGGWQLTWVVTCTCGLAGLVLTGLITRHLSRAGTVATPA